MRIKKVNGDQLITNEKHISDQKSLAIYHHIAKSDHPEVLPPAIVIPASIRPGLKGIETPIPLENVRKIAWEEYRGLFDKHYPSLDNLARTEHFRQLQALNPGHGYIDINTRKPIIEDLPELVNMLDDYDSIRSLVKSVSGSKYLLIDGNHRACAALLAGRRIPVLVLLDDSELVQILEQSKRGDIFEFPHEETSLVDLARGFYTYSLNNDSYLATVSAKLDDCIEREEVPQRILETSPYKKGTA